MEPRFFATAQEFGEWLEANHDRETELLVGFYKVGSGKPSMTWPESVDEALRFGWIDAIRRSLSPESYTIRFTRRKPNSLWSSVNITKYDALVVAGRMTEAGRKARESGRKSSYSYESAPKELPKEFLTKFKSSPAAWSFFQTQPPSYRNVAIHWIVTAKQETTRGRRLERTIQCSAKGERLPHLI